MKTSIKILGLSLVVLCMSCGATRSTQSTMEKTEQEMATKGTDTNDSENNIDDSENKVSESSNTAAQQKDNVSPDSDTNERSSAMETVSSTKDEGMDDTSKMYAKLKMTDLQIQNFESRIKDFKERKINMASGEMLGTVDNEKDRLLNEILSKEQYSLYQTLKNEK